jgi:hypothetical protein
MKIVLPLLLLIMLVAGSVAQVISVSPSSAYLQQTVSTTITLAPGVMQAANPPADTIDVYLEQSGYRIYADAFTPAQIFPGTPPYTDSLAADFTIDSAATPGWYNVHVITYDPSFVPVDNVLVNGFLVALPGSCPVPFNISADTLTGTSEIIRWDTSLVADTFRVRYRLSGTTHYFYRDVDGATGADSVILTNLDPGSLYDVDISTICLGIHSTYSYPVDTFTTLPLTLNCVTPFGISISGITNTTMQMNWSDLVTADTFRIRYYESGTLNYRYIDINGANPHTAVISNLQPGTTYIVQISAVCSGAGNGYSYARFITTLSGAVPCIVPFGIDTSNVTNSSVTVVWSPNVSADTFRIRYSVNGSMNYFYVDSPGTSGNYAVIGGLRANVTYQFQVSSVCSGSGSGYSASRIFTTANTPVNCGIPYGLSNSNVTNASADISWTNLVVADSFLIRYSVNGTTNYSWKKIVGTLNGTTLTGLSPTTTYQWQVRSLCSGAPSSYSPSDIFATPLRIASPNGYPATPLLFPNPASDNVNIRYHATEDQSCLLRIIDLSGRSVWMEKYRFVTGNNEVQIDVSALSTGVYLVEIASGETITRHRLAVSR